MSLTVPNFSNSCMSSSLEMCWPTPYTKSLQPSAANGAMAITSLSVCLKPSQGQPSNVMTGLSLCPDTIVYRALVSSRRLMIVPVNPLLVLPYIQRTGGQAVSSCPDLLCRRLLTEQESPDTVLPLSAGLAAACCHCRLSPARYWPLIG